MAILIDNKTKVIVQGMTGEAGTFHAGRMIDYKTQVVGGVTPGKGGTTHLELPVFDTVREAVDEIGAEASIIFDSVAFAADSIMEAANAGIKYCVCVTKGIPAQDMMRVKRYIRSFEEKHRMILMGSNSAGVISPGRALLGTMPGYLFKQGHIGIITRSGTLGFEVASQLSAMDIGVSTCVGVGSATILGSSFVDHLKLFRDDPETKVIIMIGEIGGTQEVDAARFFKEKMKKPLLGYIAGLSAPKGTRMGHAGAIISGFGESAKEKVEVLRKCGVTIVPTPAEFGDSTKKVLSSLN